MRILWERILTKYEKEKHICAQLTLLLNKTF